MRVKPIPFRRILLGVLAALLGIYFAFGAFVWWVMHRPPEDIGRMMARIPGPVVFLLYPFETLWRHARAGALNVGDRAPDFSLANVDKSGPIQLSQLNHQGPVVLILGSYTWPPFRREAPAINQLAEQYRDRVAFLAVYISEAHPSDLWQMESNIRDNVVFASPKNAEERGAIAWMCVRKLGLKFPAVLDEFGNSTERAYTGWPDRIYVVDSQGKIAYKSEPGPFGFKPDELAAALSSLPIAPNH